MEDTYKRIDWEDYKQMLERYGYTEEQIADVKSIRENPNYEYMSPEQFRFLHLNGIIKRTRKLKKLRTLLTDGDKVYYLEHYFKRYNTAA
jgi:general stress protein 26